MALARSLVPRDDYRRVAFPPERRFVLDTLRIGHHKAMMHGLIEVDVTRARQLLHDAREATGEPRSFTAFVLACVGAAVAAHPEVHALRDWRGRIVQFDDVDIATLIEVDVGGRPFALAHVIRAVNRRTVGELHDEIRSVQATGMRSMQPGVRVAARLALLVPGSLRRLGLRFLLRFPRFAKQRTGTVLVSAVGMFGGGGAAWGFSAPGIHGLSIVVGGIATQPPGGPHGAREVLCLTVSADHELVDGAPVARFVRDLRQRLETADALERHS